MGFYRDNSNPAKKIVEKFKKLLPAVGYELEHLCEELRDCDENVDFSEHSLDIIGRMASEAAAREKKAVKDSSQMTSFLFRNKETIGRLGAFLGCIVIENLGGRWQQEDGGLIIVWSGGTNVAFDPFQAVIKAIINPRKQSLRRQYRRLKEDIEGTGPMVFFRRRVLNEIKKRMHDVKIGRVSGLEVWLTNGTKIHLENLYATCTKSPGHSREAIEEFVAVVCSLNAAGAELPGFGEAAESLYPVLKTDGFLTRNLGNGIKVSETVVWDKFHCGLVVCYVFEREGCLRFVKNGDLDNWGASTEELRNHAIRNLQETSLQMGHRVSSTMYGRVIVLNENDGYDAARILLPELREMLSPHLGESFIIAVPCRDLLVAFERKEGLLSFMKRWIRDDAHMGAHGLTDALFVCDGEGMRPLVDALS